MGLLDIGRLPMRRENIGIFRKARRRCGSGPRGIVEAVVESQSELMFGKARRDALSERREVYGGGRKAGPEIFAADGPTGRDRGLDADTGGPAETVEEAA